MKKSLNKRNINRWEHKQFILKKKKHEKENEELFYKLLIYR